MQPENKKKQKSVMSLKQYFMLTGITQSFFAKKIKMSNQGLSEIVTGKKTPTLKTAWKIEVATEGKVTLYSWIDQLKENHS